MTHSDLRSLSYIIKAACLLVCPIRSPRGILMLVYNWIPLFHFVKIFAVLIRSTYLCCCLMVMLGMLIT